MKTNKFFLLGIFTLLMLGFTIVSCEKSETIPSEITSGVLDKKGGNGSGGNNPNTPNYNPCTWTSQYTNETVPQEFWGLTADTSVCGFVIIRWPAQAKFSPVDSCTAAGQYLVSTTTISGFTTGSPCAGNVTFTNAYYYQLGSGCSMWPGGEYAINVSYLERDTVNKVLRWHHSEGVRFRAGTRATYLGTCP